MVTPQNPGLDPWVVQPLERARYQEQFRSLNPTNGIITGEQAKGLFLRSELPPAILGQIWALSDTDSDGKMDINEFSIACKLINLRLKGFEVPASLPPNMIQSIKVLAAGEIASVVTNGAPMVLPQSHVPPGIPQPLVGPPPSNGKFVESVSPRTLPASRQNRQNVTPHIPSKPPARPAPPLMAGNVAATSNARGSSPQRPEPPTSIGSNFVPTVPPGPPPKPAPPSFPNSPVGSTMSPVRPLPPPSTGVGPAIGTIQPGAPIAPLNSNPPPIAAFGMGQSMSPVTAPPAVVAPLTAGPGVVPNLPLSSTMGASPIVAGAGMNGVAVHTPVSTSTPLSTTTRPPSMERVGSIDSQHSIHSVGSPQSIEWAVPHQTKLKYTQVFNTWDRTRSGYLSGPQARNIMVQSQLHQQILAQIWTLADMDSDGRLGCDEFVLAMHLIDLAKVGEPIPTVLPLELVPPTFRRQRQSSLTPSQCSIESVDPSAGMPQTTFEDKRKENFEKGQAELDRRRKALLDIQRKEQEERERKEREETEKQEKIRLEQERRRQAELEQQLMRQKEIEQEKEEQRKRAQEQREAARKEMERQRQLEWEKQKSQELEAQRQKEQDVLLKLKATNQTLTIELGSLNDKVKELSQKICDTRVGVSGVKTTIDGMRSTRDTQLQEMAALKSKLREQNQRLLSLSQEKARIEVKNKVNAAQDIAGQEAIKMAFDSKQITLKQMRDKIEDLQQQIDGKMDDIENNNGQLEDIKTQIKTLVDDCKQMYVNFEDKKLQVLELRKSNSTIGGITNYSAWGDTAWSNTTETNDSNWPVDDQSNKIVDETPGVKKYRALYEFVARNQDEVSFQPGDIILVQPVQNAEPGWMAGEILGHTGWFPESYVEPIDSGISNGNTFVQQDSLEKRTLEGIAEVPENVSDAGSLGGEQPPGDSVVPTLGLGTSCELQVIASSQYRSTTDQHLSFEKEDAITVTEQQGDWWYGETSTGVKGWFPKSHVQETAAQNEIEGLNEYYMALYPYASGESGDLGFNQGEVILVIKKEGDWWTGCIGDKTGIFPSNYVEKYDASDQGVKSGVAAYVETRNDAQMEKTAEQLEDERQAAEDRAELPDFSAMSAQQRGRKPEVVQAIAPYHPTSSEQLDLQKGQLIMIRKKTDTGWWEGELQARGKKRQIGWFPASYVRPWISNSNRSTPVSHRYQDSPTDPNTERVMALYPYHAQNEDELNFDKGDVINVLAKENEAWWRGELNGLSGVFPSNYVSPLSNEVMMTRLDSMEKKRQESIKELIVTEQAYIEDMRLVHEVFEKPLIESLVLTMDEIDKIFINWRDIIACNDNFLRTLRIRRDNSEFGIVRMIGDILCENIPRMSAYIRFCSCQISAAMYLQKLTESCPEFVQVAQMCQQDPRTKGMPLSSFLIKPMQRITKYPLIIGKILENTPLDHPDRQYLQEALAKAEEFCIQVNEGVREKENSDRLEWLQNHVNCNGLEEQLVFNSLTNSLGSRKILHYGILHKAKSGKELVGFLTNDFFLLVHSTKPLPAGKQFSFERNEHQKFRMYRKPIFLNELSLITGGNQSDQNGNNNENHDNKIFAVRDTKKQIVLGAPSPTECTLWIKRINEARKQFMDHEKSYLQRQRSKQAQFGACGRILVTVLEGSNLKVSSVCRKPPEGCLKLVLGRAEKLAIKKGKTLRPQIFHSHFHKQIFLGENQGKCNVFCKVSMGSQEERTNIGSNTNCPLWDASMQFQVKDLLEDTLCITVFDKGYYSPDEFLGRAEIRVADIMRDSQDTCGPIQKRIKLHEVEMGDVVLKLDLRLFSRK